MDYKKHLKKKLRVWMIKKMKLRSLKNTNVSGKTVLYRSPYDIGVKETNGILEITDPSRIKATLPTLKYLLAQNCKIVILTYVKRPDGKVVENLRTTPHAKALSKLLNRPVKKVNECVGENVQKEIANLLPQEILMLENTRFHPEEMVDDDNFAQKLAKNGEIVVFDAFPQTHRLHASTTGILRHLPSCAGFYLEKEIKMLTQVVTNPQKPLTIIIGGAKISDKVDAINNLLPIADTILLGGGVANVFLKAQGKEVGNSYLEDTFVDKVKKEKKDWVQYSQEILKKAGGKIQVPTDFAISNSRILDIGPETQEAFAKIITQSKTVFWNGPMGKFEDERFAKGSKAVMKAISKVKGTTVVAGGDTIEAVRKYGHLKNFTHISLAGGATLEFLAGTKLPALEMLRKEY